jgi:hypothetical protein
MQTVIYSQFLEPITVVDLTMEMLKSLEINRKCVLHLGHGKMVRLFAVKIRLPNMEFGEIESDIILTPDEVHALELKADWLPGQRPAINFTVKAVRAMRDRLVKLMKGGDSAV